MAAKHHARRSQVALVVALATLAACGASDKAGLDEGVVGTVPRTTVTTAAPPTQGGGAVGIRDATLVEVQTLPGYVAPSFDWISEVYDGAQYRLLVAIGPEVGGDDGMHYSDVDGASELGQAQVVGTGVLSGRDVTVSMYGRDASETAIARLMKDAAVEVASGKPSLSFAGGLAPSFVDSIVPGSTLDVARGNSQLRTYATGAGRRLSVLSQPVDSRLPLELLAGATPVSVISESGTDVNFVAFPPPAADVGWMATTRVDDRIVTVRGAASLTDVSAAISQLVVLSDEGAAEDAALNLSMQRLPIVVSGEASGWTIDYRGPDSSGRMVICASTQVESDCAPTQVLSTFAPLAEGSATLLVGVWPVNGAQPIVTFLPDVTPETKVIGDFVFAFGTVPAGVGSVRVCMTVESIPKQCADTIVD